ncbi:MAG: VWA domain-containing protein [Ardenticatenaceae bacterium]|nr:VWA domain-containing protein [Ardenticatenaceae bacterium]
MGHGGRDAICNWSFDGDFALESGTYDLQARMVSADDVELGTANVVDLVVPNLAVSQPVVIDTADVVDAGTDSGELVLHGTAVPGKQIQIIINGEVIDIVTADDDGNWSYTTTLPTGSYTVNGRYLDLSEAEANQLAASQSLTVGEPTGQLQLLFAGGAADGQLGLAPAGYPAVEIILDASGSMMELLGSDTRFETARAALQNITDNVLPDSTPIAVRVFGNIEGNYACRTDLMIPYQPLDRAAMDAFLADVEPQVDANTPIADSLARVALDLADAGDLERIVVLLTDGEETCGGDPAAQIQKLRDAGIGVQVNIVGLAIADDALKAEFERWVEIGGGQYVDVTDPGRLAEVLGELLLVPYVVRNEAGEVVVNGRVGGPPQTLPIGTYEVLVGTVPAMTFDSVEIVTGEMVQLTLGE